LADRLNVPLAIVDKRRPKANVSEVMNIIGSIEGRTVILVDDMIDTGGSITGAANALKNRGASDVYACCTHGVLSGNAVSRIQESAISELVMLDTLPLSPEHKIPKIKLISVAEMFADAINRIHEGISISSLFE
jgi:ribose-phosphate pyrophosphokinase